MKLAVRSLAAAAGLVLSACAAPALPPPGAPQTFARADVEQGAALAKVGDCQGCHTAEEGRPYAGGRPIATPFGQVFATNLTPDAQTGIGGYSREAFRRAMRQGLRRDGAELYPAFPYDHFSYAADADFDALYAFLMTRAPVSRTNTPNRLVPPIGFRPVVAIWKALYFRPEPFHPVAGQSDDWNRGAYLVQSFGHCGGCHTPHNALGAEKKAQALDGGYAEGWYAPPLNATTPASVPWTVDRLETYLRTGLDVNHAAAAGPMGPVVRELAEAPARDLHAMAVYLAERMNAARRARPVDQAGPAAAAHPEGAALFAGACAGCHDAGAAMMREGRPPLQLGTPLHEDDPRDTIQIVLKGLRPPLGASGPYMPPFAAAFTDGQLAEIAAYLRARYSDRPPWRDLPRAVAKARKEGDA